METCSILNLIGIQLPCMFRRMRNNNPKPRATAAPEAYNATEDDMMDKIENNINEYL